MHPVKFKFAPKDKVRVKGTSRIFEIERIEIISILPTLQFWYCAKWSRIKYQMASSYVESGVHEYEESDLELVSTDEWLDFIRKRKELERKIYEMSRVQVSTSSQFEQELRQAQKELTLMT